MTTKQTRPATILAGTLLASALLAGCTGDDDPTPTGTGSGSTDSSSPSESTSPEAKDRSSEVLADPPTLTPVVTTKAKSTSTFRGSTFTIYGLSRTDSATILTYSVTGGTTPSSPSDSLPRVWDKAPSLVTPTHAYRVVTFQEESKEWAAVANPIYKIDASKESGPLTMLYPPLPKDVTTVTLRGLWFEDVAVPVTDATTG